MKILGGIVGGFIIAFGMMFFINFSQEDLKSDLEGYPLESLDVLTSEDESYTFEVAIANDWRERALGLQYVEYLPETQGMWFIFENEAERLFWMKDTLIHLDIIFVDADFEIIKIHHDVPTCREEDEEQLDCPNYRSAEPSQYVLELKGGTASKYGFSEGDTILGPLN